MVLKTDVEPVFGPVREGDVRDSQADIAKARQLLGFTPTVPFDEGLRETIAWFQSRSGN
jgi:nucleoside-diphosphate-sugar epimerase